MDLNMLGYRILPSQVTFEKRVFGWSNWSERDSSVLLLIALDMGSPSWSGLQRSVSKRDILLTDLQLDSSISVAVSVF